MTTLIECIPNVSEGRRPEVVSAVRNAAVSAGPGVLLLDWTSDADHNRSVLTFLGDGPALVRAMEAMVAEALVHVDLTKHEGAHPRLGAVDVIPFVPIRGATTADCVALARELGARLAERHGLPDLSLRGRRHVRGAPEPGHDPKGGVRGPRREDEEPRVEARLRSERPAPDRGGDGRRGALPLVAYNINLGTADLSIADRIAKSIRHLSGGFRFVKAMGVRLEARGIVQVSINMTNYEKTPLHRVFETVRSEAERFGVPVVGSEIVGLVPQAALVGAAEHYLRLESPASAQVLENKLLDVALAAKE